MGVYLRVWMRACRFVYLYVSGLVGVRVSVYFVCVGVIHDTFTHLGKERLQAQKPSFIHRPWSSHYAGVVCEFIT